MKQQNYIQNKKYKTTENFFEEILHNFDLKITRSRLEVLKIFYKSNKPITHTDVMENLPNTEHWDRVTIYRTLSEFSDKQILRQLVSNDRISYFELKKEEKGHGHLVCDSCGKIECLKNDSVQIQIKNEKSNFKILSFEILARGLCGECA